MKKQFDLNDIFLRYQERFPVGARVRYTKEFRQRFPSLTNKDSIFFVRALTSRNGMTPCAELNDETGRYVSSILADNIEVAA